MTVHINAKCSKCNSKNVKATGRKITTPRYKNGADEIECKDCGNVDYKGKAGRPAGTTSPSAQFLSEHSNLINKNSVKALKLIGRMLDGDVKGATPSNQYAAAAKAIETAQWLEKLADKEEGKQGTVKATEEEEGVHKPVINLTAPSTDTIN